MNGTIADQINMYSEQQQTTKYAAQPVKGYYYPNSQRYTNPSYTFDQSENAPFQPNPLLNTSPDSQQMYKQRAGIGRVQQKNKSQHKKWGNFLVIYQGKFTLTLGPDYWCFIPAFICFSVIGISVLVLILNNTESLVIKLSGFFVCLGELIAYFLIATSNPGIAVQEDDELILQDYENPQKSQPMKTCNKCGFSVPKSCFHCKDCDVCIIGYDHHCPWTSKCIGDNNLCRFYFFLAMTPIFLVYVAVAFVMIISQQQQNSRRQHIRKLLMQINSAQLFF